MLCGVKLTIFTLLWRACANSSEGQFKHSSKGKCAHSSEGNVHTPLKDNMHTPPKYNEHVLLWCSNKYYVWMKLETNQVEEILVWWYVLGVIKTLFHLIIYFSIFNWRYSTMHTPTKGWCAHSSEGIMYTPMKDDVDTPPKDNVHTPPEDNVQISLKAMCTIP